MIGTAVDARYYEKLEDKAVRCILCPHRCVVKPGSRGVCRVRKNEDGVLKSIGYGKTISISMDPMEKKPLYHFYPATYILSVGVNGCNLSCDFCQNYESSQMDCPTRFVSPQDLVEIAFQNNSVGVCFTYTEPFVWWEYVYDTSKIAKDRGLVSVLVTNGYINEGPLLEILPFIDAMNVDLKSIENDFYKKRCNGVLEPVLNTLKISNNECHIEVTNLIIPGANDSPDKIEELVLWISENLGKETVLHISRYFPHYKAKEPPTPIETLENAYNIAKRHLTYVYLGNLFMSPAHTYCNNCGELLIERYGYNINVKGLKGSKCVRCGYETGIIR
ncbi:MAG: AmmeMemoRadiSam system radical SAM enzyme [bacterium]